MPSENRIVQVESLVALAGPPDYIKDYDLSEALFFRFLVEEVNGPFVVATEVAWCPDKYYFAWKLMYLKTDQPAWPEVHSMGAILSETLQCADAIFDLMMTELVAYHTGEEAGGGACIAVFEDSLMRVAWCLTVV